MQQVLILGSGKSAIYLIEYLLQWTLENHWKIKIADFNTKHISNLKIENAHLTLVDVDLSNEENRTKLIEESYIVVSMLPAFMHPLIAEQCILNNVHLATASYESDFLKKHAEEIKEKSLFFINECGLDPGIDHMSAMKVIHHLQNIGAKVTGFHSYCGGLIAKESIDGPWAYKFSWNPRNVILAGQGTARFLENGKLKFVPYQRVFAQPKSILMSDGTSYDGYPNRDSLEYKNIYGLKEVDTLIRGTLRHAGFCKSWNFLVQLGITDDTFQFPISEDLTYRSFIEAFLPEVSGDLKSDFKKLLGNDYSDVDFEKLEWTGLLSEEKVKVKNGSPAQIVQALLEDKWKLQEEDKDLIVMQHLFEYQLNNENYKLTSSLSLTGESQIKTAMAKTVGLPLAIAVKLFLEGKLIEKGLILPITPNIYTPILDELEHKHGIQFIEEAI
jgi:saccharopine dehydrogenase-like NADP-dependent oxidoreductase